MTFLTPWAAVLAAAIALPLLLLLYFLKLRRQPLRLASTLLWRKSVEDLQVNTPFQRLRWSLLLLLQLLILLLLILAIGQPVLETDAPASTRLIIVIDRSASMSAADALPAREGKPRTRLEAAKDAARRLVRRVGEARGPEQVMVLSFASSAQVVTGWESNAAILADAIDSIAPTDEPADLAAAFRLAGAFATPGEDEAAQLPSVTLISDGGVIDPAEGAPPGGFALRAGEFTFVNVGPAAGGEVRNVGVVSLDARRSYENPADVQVFVRLINASPEPLATTARLLMNGEAIAIEPVEIPPAGATEDDPPSEAVVTFAFQHADGAVLAVTHGEDDAFPADDLAAVVLPAPAALRIAMVSPGGEPDPFLRDLLSALDPAALRVMTPEAYAVTPAQEIDSGSLWDFVVFDRISGHRLPGVPSLTVGGVPVGVASTPPSTEGGRRIMSWDRAHPLMRDVSLDNLVFAGFGSYELPSAATAIALGPDGPVLALAPMRGARHVLIGFELMMSNWAPQVSFAVFMQNVVDHLTLAGVASEGVLVQPGETISVRAAPGAAVVIVRDPLGSEVHRARADRGGPIVLPPLERVGLYVLEGAAPPMDRIAVSLVSEQESDIRPRRDVLVNAQRVDAAAAEQIATRDLWPWFVLTAFGLLILEWLVYALRMRGA